MLCASVAGPLPAFDFLRNLGASGSFRPRIEGFPPFCSRKGLELTCGKQLLEPCHVRPSSLWLIEPDFGHFLTFLIFSETYIVKS
jgi:hypothetical protein